MLFSPKTQAIVTPSHKSIASGVSSDVSSVRDYHDDDAPTTVNTEPAAADSPAEPAPDALPVATLRPRSKLQRDNSSAKLFSFSRLMQSKGPATTTVHGVEHTPIRIPSKLVPQASAVEGSLDDGARQLQFDDMPADVQHTSLSAFLQGTLPHDLGEPGM